MNKLLLCIALTLVCLLSAKGTALAWGPGVHLAVGNYLLSNLGLLSAALSQLLLAHTNSFLYGCLSADFFIGKGCKACNGHSHNWSTGFKLTQSASTPQLQAYAYGYLTHLAADIVSHNYYVPNVLWTTPGKGRLSHLYVEAQADMRVDWNRAQARALFGRHNRPEDLILLTAMTKSSLAFRIKKQIYRGTLSIFERRSWCSSLLFMDRALPLTENDRFLNRMLDLSLKTAIDVLRQSSSSPVTSFDPIGSRHLRMVKERTGYRPHPALRRNGIRPVFKVDPLLTRLPSPKPVGRLF
jgi:hypothetical protein